MSELKERMLGQTMNEYGCDTKIYLKSEADKVIAELKEENESLKYSVATLETDLAMSQRWRKCSEELPQNGQDVWAYDSKSKSVLHLEYEKSDEGEGFIVFPYMHDFQQNITQWMPFEKPKAPKVEK